MLTPDQINGGIELVGAYFTWKNFSAYRKVRRVEGIYWPGTAFFTAWGLWNLYYYPSLGQWCSFSGGALLVSGSVAWLGAVLWDKLNESIDVWPSGEWWL